MTRMFVAVVPAEPALDDLDEFLSVRRSAGELVESHLGQGPRRAPRYEVRETFALRVEDAAQPHLRCEDERGEER